jgi:hypothetical protein
MNVRKDISPRDALSRDFIVLELAGMYYIWHETGHWVKTLRLMTKRFSGHICLPENPEKMWMW